MKIGGGEGSQNVLPCIGGGGGGNKFQTCDFTIL